MLVPMYDYVLIKRDDKEEKTAAGILLAESENKKPASGTVIAVGEGRLLKDGTILPLRVKPGHKVNFGKYAGEELKEGDETFVILREDNILAFIAD